MNILEKADKYADGKANEAITKAIAQAYMDGYRDGYKDREEEIPVDFRNTKTVYVDLGLPSRTLWAADYEKTDDKLLYLPYGKAEYYKLPTKEQWLELRDKCQWQCYENGGRLIWARCIGPNGNTIKFEATGYKQADLSSDRSEIYFWIEETDTTNVANIYYTPGAASQYVLTKHICGMFSGYHVPIRLVR